MIAALPALLLTLVTMLSSAVSSAPPAAPAAPPAQAPAPEAPPEQPPHAPRAPAPRAVPKSMHEVVLKDLEGNDVPLSKYAGKPMVIEVWATWCGPCVRQRALMTKLAPEYKEKVVFIGASVDSEGAPKVKQHLVGKPECKEMIDLMATPALLELVRTREPGNTVPKVIYVDSRGRMTDVSASVQNESWMRAMLKNLK